MSMPTVRAIACEPEDAAPSGRIGVRFGRTEETRHDRGWLGEIEGVDLTLQCLRDKRANALRLTRITRQVDLGMPAMGTVQ